MGGGTHSKKTQERNLEVVEFRGYFMLSRIYFWSIVALISHISCMIVIAQPAGIAPSAGQKTVTEIVAYGSLMRMFAGLDQRANDLDAKGIISSGLRVAISNKLDLNLRDFTSFLVRCRATELRLKVFDAEANSLISAMKADFRATGGKSSPVSPRIPPRLEMLQQQRDGIVSGAISSLRTELSPEGQQKLAQYLKFLLGSDQVVVSK